MTEKYVLVTGGAQNIGKAISKRLTEDGFQIIILDIKEPSHEYFTEFNNSSATIIFLFL